jgi:hypothetical protein
VQAGGGGAAATTPTTTTTTAHLSKKSKAKLKAAATTTAAPPPAVQSFISYALGAGQRFGPSLDFAPLPKNVLAADRGTVSRIG